MLGISSLRGLGFFILQALRVCTVITLLASAAACWVLIIKVDKSRTVFPFECISLFFTSCVSAILIISEFPMIGAVRRYLSRTWPVLSVTHGLGWLGLAMAIVGCNIIGTLNQPAYDAGKLGPHFSKLTLGAGVLDITFGVLNIVSAFVWRDGKEGITSRDIRSDGSLADNSRETLPSYTTSTPASSLRNEKTQSKFMSMFWKKEEAGKPMSRPQISGPFQAHQDIEHDAGHDADRLSPIVPGVKRPDTALHPMHTGRSSVYSEAHLSRF